MTSDVLQLAGLREALAAAVDRAATALFAEQREDGHLVYELEADATIPAEYVLLRAFLGEPADAGLEAKLIASGWRDR